MKILIVINDYMNKSNGMSVSTQRFVKAFRSMGHDVRMVANNRYGKSEYSLDVVKIPVISDIIEKRGYVFAKVNRDTIRQAVTWADVIHIEEPFLVCRRAAIEAKKMNKPVTGTFHFYPENITSAVHMEQLYLINYGIMRLFLKSVYNRCDYVHCPTTEVKRRLECCRIKSKLEVISNGIDEYFLHQSRTHEFDGTLHILSVGRYAVEKRQRTLIEAVAKSSHKDKIHLMIAGKGPLEKDLKSLSDQLGINVDYGFLPQDRLRETMLVSDLYVHCADIEVEGMSCMEAFACGCVPIISDAHLSSTKSFALQKYNLFKNGNSEDLANTIDHFFEHPELMHSQSEEYMQYAETFCVSGCAQKLVSMMKQAVRENNKLR